MVSRRYASHPPMQSLLQHDDYSGQKPLLLGTRSSSERRQATDVLRLRMRGWKLEVSLRQALDEGGQQSIRREIVGAACRGQ